RGTLSGTAGPKMARGSGGTEPPVAAAGWTPTGADRCLRPLHRLPAGPILVPPEDGGGPRRPGRHDRPAKGGAPMKLRPFKALCAALLPALLLSACWQDLPASENPSLPIAEETEDPQ